MSQIAALGLPFRKMHGLGNDFVVLDARESAVDLTRDQVRAISDRKLGVGFDQMITLAPSDTADAVMRIHNWDGGEVESCGNAARCVAWLLMRESGRSAVTIDTKGGFLSASSAGDGLITVDMGQPRFDWQAIPLAREMDTAALDFRLGPLDRPSAVNVGNPHVVFVVPDAEAVDLEALGPKVEHDPLFPERVNVEVITVRDRGHLRMRVWERGVGITRACGTGACAVGVNAARLGLTDRRVAVQLDGGTLVIEWTDDDRILMTGPVAESFTGRLDPRLLGAAG
jgi:diaminopimelate epimerase